MKAHLATGNMNQELSCLRPGAKRQHSAEKSEHRNSTEVTRGRFSLEHSPMKLAGILSLVLIGAVLAGCNLKESTPNNLAADQWLQANIGSSGLNVSGAWEAEDPDGELSALNKVGRG